MPRIFVNPGEISGATVVLTGQNAHHVAHVLRAKPGDKLTVCDFFNTEYDCTVAAFSGDTVTLTVESSRPADTEPPFPVTLCMALPKGDKMEWIIQKSVELGVSRILPFSSRYTVVKLDREAAGKKRERWQKISLSAAEQCGRGRVPEILAPVSFAEALAFAGAQDGVSFLCYEAEDEFGLGRALAAPEAKRGVTFFVGAEGGFSPEEIASAAAAGIPAVTLGRRILRCETAPLYVLSVIAFLGQQPS